MTCSMPTKSQLLVLGGYVVNLILTYLSNTGAYGCTNKGQSDKYYTLITPPGWAFAIWGVIFIWEGISCVFQALPSQKVANSFTNDTMWVIGWLVACVAQSLWSIMFCHDVKLAAALLFTIWIGLAVMIVRAKILLTNLRRNAGTSMAKIALSYLVMGGGFAIHLGWVTAAATLNVQIAAIASNSTAETLLSLAVLSVAFAVAMAFVFGVMIGDPMVGYGLVWALNAVSHHQVRPINTNLGMYSYPSVVDSALSSAAHGAAILVAVVTTARLAFTAKDLFHGCNSHHAGCCQDRDVPLINTTSTDTEKV